MTCSIAASSARDRCAAQSDPWARAMDERPTERRFFASALWGRLSASAAELEKLLHPDFYEFGASGRTWDRSGTILALTGDRPPAEDAPATAAGITGIRLADDVVHVTYLSRRDQRSSHRSSIWLRTGAGWRLYFHQGTLTPIS
jgi:hypothetical protein